MDNPQKPVLRPPAGTELILVSAPAVYHQRQDVNHTVAEGASQSLPFFSTASLISDLDKLIKFSSRSRVWDNRPRHSPTRPRPLDPCLRNHPEESGGDKEKEKALCLPIKLSKSNSGPVSREWRLATLDPRQKKIIRRGQCSSNYPYIPTSRVE